MLRWLLRRTIESFERKWNYDASYLKEIVDLSPVAALKFSLATSLGATVATVGASGAAGVPGKIVRTDALQPES